MSQIQRRKKPALIAASVSVIAALAIGLYAVPALSTETSELVVTANKDEEKAIEIAQKFVRSSPTYSFDGIDGTLDLISVDVLESLPVQYHIKVAFESSQGGFGNRDGQMLTQVITPHVMSILVTEGQVISAVTDETWDELNHQYILKKLPSSNEPVQYFDGIVNDYVTFLEAINSRGLTFELIETVDDSSFSVPMKTLSISGIETHVYEFETEQDAQMASKTVSSDGTQIGNNVIRWMDTPHFYTQGKIIVLYVGQNPEITSLLDSLLGSQFAGM
ncbi:MAG: hypothetical protein DWQ18_03300 [Crenarchaeota archaeon]|nr:MAG: hypothetical protein DWQ17_05225 [Thermoproteota archaeon]RDJ33946.1 MAG: hypothetical protein DWQ18_03300 [Thermoproteota archaeon]RDJ36941.1 MAG: hypothetical protein DWQ13_07315 [Thermoproteota archaeon]RDJ37524.1 MAG: hypothetical protein DWQ19_03520 [Thermoproteota archaeon]